jgi:hypothetical protein
MYRDYLQKVISKKTLGGSYVPYVCSQQLFLKFFILQGANLALSSAKKSNKQGAAAAATPHSRAGGRAAVGGKDQSLVLFHGLGKVLYAKRASTGPPEPCPLPAALERHRRLPLLADPEQVLENTPIRCVSLLLYASHCLQMGTWIVNLK